eukprot:1156313-Pelagomonas_calceolata.AAC.9
MGRHAAKCRPTCAVKACLNCQKKFDLACVNLFSRADFNIPSHCPLPPRHARGEPSHWKQRPDQESADVNEDQGASRVGALIGTLLDGRGDHAAQLVHHKHKQAGAEAKGNPCG